MVVQRMLRGSFFLLVLGCVLGTSLSQAQRYAQNAGSESVSLRDKRSGFGKPETISGTISVVDERGLLTLRRQGPGEPATTDLTVAETRSSPGEPGKTAAVDASPGLGQTDYTFRITSATRISVNGSAKSRADLGELQSRQATIYFVPRRSGNFATQVVISQ